MLFAIADVGVLLQVSENTEIKRILLHSWLTIFCCVLLMWNIYFTAHSSDNYIWIVYGFSVRWENVKHKQGIRKAVIIKYVKYCTGTSFCGSVRMKNEYKSKHVQEFQRFKKAQYNISLVIVPLFLKMWIQKPWILFSYILPLTCISFFYHLVVCFSSSYVFFLCWEKKKANGRFQKQFKILKWLFFISLRLSGFRDSPRGFWVWGGTRDAPPQSTSGRWRVRSHWTQHRQHR